nr:hypothetical protein Hi04_10k_c554_00011 [uncultured bacterium]
MLLARIGLLFSHRTVNRPDHEHSGKPGPSSLTGTPARIVWALQAVSRRLPGKNSCLVQALAAQAMLRQRGYASEFRIGVSGRDPTGAIKAHAWVECDGRVVLGQLEDLNSYAVLTAPPPDNS